MWLKLIGVKKPGRRVDEVYSIEFHFHFYNEKCHEIESNDVNQETEVTEVQKTTRYITMRQNHVYTLLLAQ
jgi:hypothetical protein